MMPVGQTQTHAFTHRHEVDRNDPEGRPVPICTLSVPSLDTYIEFDVSSEVDEFLGCSLLADHAETGFANISSELEIFERLDEIPLGSMVSDRLADADDRGEDIEVIVEMLSDTIMPYVMWRKPSYVRWMKGWGIDVTSAPKSHEA